MYKTEYTVTCNGCFGLYKHEWTENCTKPKTHVLFKLNRWQKQRIKELEER